MEHQYPSGAYEASNYEYYYDDMEDPNNMDEIVDDSDDDDDASMVEIDRMRITGEERQWALTIKGKVEASTGTDTSTGLRPLSDMEYAQHALASEGNIDQALRRIEHMQWCKEEYKIDDTPEQGRQCMMELMRAHPGFFLQLDIDFDTGEGIVATDVGAYYPSRSLKCSPTDRVMEQNWKIHIKGQYYLLRCLNPSLQSIREGFFILWEASTMGHANFDSTYSKRLHEEMRHHYPTQYKKCMIYNPSAEAHVLFAMAKVAGMPSKLPMVVEFGCQVHLTDPSRPKMTLRELYLQPNLEETTNRMLMRAHELLTSRSENERTFRLR